jgi:hypothetical protein
MKNDKHPGLDEISLANETARIELDPTPETAQRVCTLLPHGCYVTFRSGFSLRQVLCEQFNISPDYLKYEIKVLFLNNSPVDNLDTAFIKDGSTLALSAAMPGLVGAAMRRDGLSWMRSSITYQEQEEEHKETEGVIQLKLFNKVMADLGESFLKRGIYVRPRFLAAFFRKFTPEFWQGCGTIAKNGQSVTVDGLFDYLDTYEGWVRVSIP